MEQLTVRERIYDCITDIDVCDNKEPTVLADTLDLTDDLCFDIVDRTNLVFDLEYAFGIRMPPESEYTLRTVGEVVALVEELLASKR